MRICYCDSDYCYRFERWLGVVFLEGMFLGEGVVVGVGRFGCYVVYVVLLVVSYEFCCVNDAY